MNNNIRQLILRRAQPDNSKRDKATGNKNVLLPLLCALPLLSACQSLHAPATPGADTQGAKVQASKQVLNQEDIRLNQLMDEIWQYRLKVDPFKATKSGDNRYNHLLPDFSPEALAQKNQQLLGYVNRLEALNRQQLSRENIINLDILLRQLNNDISSYRFKKHYVPIMAESGFHSDFTFTVKGMPFDKAQDYRNYLSRLNGLPRYFNQKIHWMKQGLATGRTLPQAVLSGFEQGIAAFIVDDPVASVLYAPLQRQAPADLSQQAFEQLQQEAKSLLSAKVIPAYQGFYDFMVETYIPQARKTVGLAATPGGRDFYQNRVKYYTTTDESPEQIFNLGMQEVKRIRSEMEEIIRSLNFNGDFAAFVNFLRTDPQFYAKTPEDLLKEASYIAKKMDAKLPALFKHLPRTPYGVVPVPEHLAPKYTTGRYIASAQDTQPGYYWVNTYALDRRPLYVLEALTLHEAVPGHHLQNAINRELSNLPPHRRYSYISAFGEGWGLYSEYLGLEAGFYQDPYSNFGRLTYEMWRACRLVIDTGIHSKGWSRQQAIDFLQQNTALSVHNVITEVDRYISWPGQALSYKMGELTIKRLRRETEQALGDKFDIREFHDQVLKHGSVPLQVLEQQIKHYVEGQQQGS
ncbi:DUF885 domain-containing protein [Thalassomonas haliotis]|uniref:DUF885 domain-containing protein n=1 Tax=Thalassomonas haliotis TaxID=485448 RepID=A0ABY7VBP4_9GAMM|nr:DUF885 domain-containing protein [Thalassomonas haliotis]WDE10302.1 DUF885 domain-containing protein [Thalassomonas haliotis]